MPVDKKLYSNDKNEFIKLTEKEVQLLIELGNSKKTSSKNTGRGNTIIATSTIIPSGNIPDLRMSVRLPVNDVLLLVNSMTLASPCQK